MELKFISGGQTGVDQIFLRVAEKNGIPTGGTAAKGWMTEDGPMEELLRGYGLVECEEEGYPARTLKNVLDSDASVLFGDTRTPGSVLIQRLCKKYGKILLINPWPAEVELLVKKNRFTILNGAGNKGSKLSPRSANRIAEYIEKAIILLKH